MKLLKTTPRRYDTNYVKIEFADKAKMTINITKKGERISSPLLVYDSATEMHPMDIFTEEEIAMAIDKVTDVIKHYK